VCCHPFTFMGKEEKKIGQYLDCWWEKLTCGGEKTKGGKKCPIVFTPRKGKEDVQKSKFGREKEKGGNYPIFNIWGEKRTHSATLKGMLRCLKETPLERGKVDSKSKSSKEKKKEKKFGLTI